MKKILSAPFSPPLPFSLFLGFWLLHALSSKAQSFDVAFGNEVRSGNLMSIKFPRRELVPVGNGFLSVQLNTNPSPFFYSPNNKRIRVVKFGIGLCKWDSSMTLTKSGVLFNGERSYGPFPPCLFNFYSQPFLLYYRFLTDDQDSKLQVLLAKIDTATLEPGQPRQLFLLEQKSLGLSRWDVALNIQPVGVAASPDSSKILLFCASRTDNDLFIKVLDRHLGLLWSKEQAIWSDGIPALQSVCVNNRGSVFFTYFPGGQMDHPEGRIGIRNPDGTSADREFRFKSGRPVSFSLLNTKDSNAIAITGAWSDKPDHILGVYEARIDVQANKIDRIRQIPFPDTLVKKLEQRHWAMTRRKKYGLEPIDLQPFLLNDGSIGLIGEFRRDWNDGEDTWLIDGDFLYAHLPADTAGTALFRELPNFRLNGAISTYSYFAFPWSDQVVVYYTFNWDETQKGQSFRLGSDNVDLMAAVFSGSGEVKTELLINYARDHYEANLEVIQALSPSASLVLLEKIRDPVLEKIRDPDKVEHNFEWCRITIR